MPRMQEAALPLVGTALSVEKLTKYDREKRQSTNEPDGFRVLVQSALGDFASVKLPQTALGEVAVPGPGTPVAYVVRYGAYAGQNGSGESYVSFLRELSANDLDLVVSGAGVGV